MKKNKPVKLLSVILPVHNEEGGIGTFIKELVNELKKIGYDFQIVICDDGSTDASNHIIRNAAKDDENIKLITFTRNFGKEAAISAGLREAKGDVFIVMDSDFQHPIDVIKIMVNQHETTGCHIVSGCRRSFGKKSWLYNLFSSLYYRVLFSNSQFKNSSDFKLLDKVVVDKYLDLGERCLFFKGIISWLGFSETEVYFDVPDRPYGETKWSIYKLLKYAVSNVISFSSFPLYFPIIIGIAFLFFSILLAAYVLYQYVERLSLPGFTTVILLILFTSSLQMLSLGILSLYAERLYVEAKGRPVYIIDQMRSML